MAEDNPGRNAPAEKKWTEWSVVSMGDGRYRCKRANAEEPKDVEYQEVPRPAFSKEELMSMIDFGLSRLLPSDDIVHAVYDRRYRENAFSACARLNAEAK